MALASGSTDDYCVAFFVTRTVDMAPALTVELRVGNATALLWDSQAPPGSSLREACVTRALREAHELLRARDITEGRWRLTWRATRVEIEQLSSTLG
jgi:hypothetical protein